ncbi:MAG: Clp protease [Actinobacteria bacterium]|nr:Clp protease [Actinomycetota bacterium]
MFERFTSSAREAVVQAQAAARDLRHNYIGTEHLLLGLGLTEQSVAERVLRGLGLESRNIRSGIVRIVGEGPPAPIRTGDAEALRSIGIDIDEIRRRTEEAFGPGALDRPLPVRRWSLRGRRTSRCISISGHIPFTSRAKKVMELSFREALRLGHKYVGTEHILLALVRDGEGVAACLLEESGVSAERVRIAVLDALREPNTSAPPGEGS